jgi:sulfur carrier protein ThiS adenylyltransferase
MKIFIAEQETEIEPGTRLFELRARIKPDADVMIHNCVPVETDRELKANDTVVFLKRGEIPSSEELESLMRARHSPRVHEKIRNKVVGVAGLGGLGSVVAVALCRMGIGKLILVDFDVVEPSNLNRQQYFVEQIGQNKSEAMVKNLKRINPYVALEAHTVRLNEENIPKIFSETDLLVEAFDRADQKAMLVESFSAAFPEKPVVMASGVAGHGPGTTLGVHAVGRKITVVGDLESAARPGRGLMAPRVGIAAHLQANVALRLLLGESPE